MKKNLEYYLNLTSRDDKDHLVLIESNISGGKIAKETIDSIQDYSSLSAITLSGLTQETFEYFIENYGGQFIAINFWKCPRIQDLSSIADLKDLQYLTFFWNQKASNLWDFSKSISLRGLSISDFTRLKDLTDLEKSESLEELSFGNYVWNTFQLDTLEPLKKLQNLKTLDFSAKKIIDGKIDPIASIESLESVEFPGNLFSTEQVCWLKAKRPNLKSKLLQPYWKIENPLDFGEKQKDTFIVGKRKPFLDSTKDAQRIHRYKEKFENTVKWFLDNPKAKPEDFPK